MEARCIIGFVALWLVATASGQGSLLQMSQGLWQKLLAGGLKKVGTLDPLRVPVIKVDQSEGDTSYRMILKNVEIIGLNASTLESVHIARGRLKSNLSELEAGYVSYSDLRDLDAIRYRFHTLVKEPKTGNETFEAIVSATNRDSKLKVDSMYSSDQENRFASMKDYDPFLQKLLAEQKKAAENQEATTQKSRESAYRAFNMAGARVFTDSQDTQILGQMRYRPDSRSVSSAQPNPAANSGYVEPGEDVVDCRGGCQRRTAPAVSERVRARGNNRREYYAERGSYADAEDSASETFETRLGGNRGGRTSSESSESLSRGHSQREDEITKSRLENRSGYIDITYADGKNNGSFKRFGNRRINENGEARIYGLEELMKDVRDNRRFIVHNFTEGEALSKRNDVIRTAMEAKRIKDMIRYAKNYQEDEGYFEEGMQLIYHYGGMDPKNPRARGGATIRQKRAHKNDDTEEDVMHVILRIRVPLLRVKSDYELMGKVGKEFVRGNGKFNGNFTELIGDFTLELKKVDENMMIVRAARSKLEAKDQKVDLQGMDEEGPVSSILKHGLMAAEAVAAMLADDLATKALSEKTADAMIYRMYKNLPNN